jgi:hypothetical protein
MFVISRRANGTRNHSISIVAGRFAAMNRFWICTFAIMSLCLGAFLLPAVSQSKDREKPKDEAKRIQVLEKELADREAEFKAFKEEHDKESKKLRLINDLLQRERKELDSLLAAKVEKEKEVEVAIVPRTPVDSAAVMEMLKQTIDTRGLQEKVKLKVALEYFSDKTAGKLAILIDMTGFANETDADAGDPYDEEVVLPPHPSKMPMGAALNLILNQVDKGRATFLVCQGRLEIVRASHATARRLMGERIFVSFDKQPLSTVLAELSDMSGLAINIDPGVGDKAAKPIRASLRNTSVEDALVTVTEMADLKFVVLHHSIYVTTASKVKTLQEEENQRSKKREEFNKAQQNQKKRLEAASQ